jgi:cysteine desulfurase/selenocysteine lyase
MNHSTVTTNSSMPLDAEAIRADFPILNQNIHHNKRLIYLDNAASTQRPQVVIDATSEIYEKTYANVHRGIHYLSEQSTALYEQSRAAVAQFIGADNEREVIFTPGTTFSINLVSCAWGDANISAGDEILLTEMEHHSNIVPWQQLAQRKNAIVRFAPFDDRGQIDRDQLQQMLTNKTKIFAFTAVSNVLGTINPVSEMVQMAKNVGAVSVVDAAQHVPHEPTNITDWDADFVAFGGHKMLGPSGIGILQGKLEFLETMPPFLGGGSMISTVTTDGFTPGAVPAKFEAGTPPIAQAIAMKTAIEYLQGIGLDKIKTHEQTLAALAHQVLENHIDGVRILGPGPDEKAGIVSFVVDGISPQDIALLIDRQGIAIRAGHHCAMPLHEKLGIASSCRASFYLYNTIEDVNQFVDALGQVIRKLR